MTHDLRRIVLAIANLPVSIPRGRGRRVVTLFEALIRKVASGRVHRRATVMEFIRLVQHAASLPPEAEDGCGSAPRMSWPDYIDQLYAEALAARQIENAVARVVDVVKSQEPRP